jgi:alpha-1,2-mannosyltransferase
MYLVHRGEPGTESRVHGWMTRHGLTLFSSAMLVFYVIFLAVWAWSSHGFTTTDASRPGLDFSVFWTAAYMMLGGHPLQVYDPLVFGNTQLALFGGFAAGHSGPWLYPPAFLLLVTPLALLPYPVAYAMFIGGSALLFVTATMYFSGLSKALGGAGRAGLLLVASPCVFVAAIIGQNSLLSAAIATLALRWIDRYPVRAGVCIGLLAMKPQLGLVFPFVLIAARAWRIFAIAALSALLVSAIGALACGVQSLHAFLDGTQALRGTLMEQGSHNFWFASPSPLAALRVNGVPIVSAYVAHLCVAVIAIGAACHVWRNSTDARLRGSILVVSTLIASPYLWHYELAWLGIALACLTALGFESGWMRGEQEVVALGWILPLYEHFNRVTQLPQIGPVVLLLVMLVILRRVRKTAGVKS